MTNAVDALRAFNRFHSQWAGLLRPSYMDSGLGVTAARLLYEIGRAPTGGLLASDLCADLALDPGYVSRVLSRFEKSGWIARDRGRDARQRPIRLTPAGEAFLVRLDQRTRADTAARIAHLSPGNRAVLVAALAQVRALLDPAAD
ncbi:DNA-binding MarR family transcriptional regulator [Sphingobium fontiphilum]|uniref:DNA-binding MarR family transcriptional regulator n=1 Tax=Sphingobium fontiphilum TaxID=944425 RepID=A0A7W6DP67_9SPHN|nr:MarR family transcriptional regulator [Sphingobium fontiphilum]MBB3983488.1 DNA-binding MarR family transcriptional regulator [Sphingobium fontiphilum]